MNVFRSQEVLLPGTKKIRTMDVTSTHQVKETGKRGTVKFGGKTIVVVWDSSLNFWLHL